jgi:hypothetical protein
MQRVSFGNEAHVQTTFGRVGTRHLPNSWHFVDEKKKKTSTEAAPVVERVRWDIHVLAGSAAPHALRERSSAKRLGLALGSRDLWAKPFRNSIQRDDAY